MTDHIWLQMHLLASTHTLIKYPSRGWEGGTQLVGLTSPIAKHRRELLSIWWTTMVTISLNKYHHRHDSTDDHDTRLRHDHSDHYQHHPIHNNSTNINTYPYNTIGSLANNHRASNERLSLHCLHVQYLQPHSIIGIHFWHLHCLHTHLFLLFSSPCIIKLPSFVADIHRSPRTRRHNASSVQY